MSNEVVVGGGAKVRQRDRASARECRTLNILLFERKRMSRFCLEKKKISASVEVGLLPRTSKLYSLSPGLYVRNSTRKLLVLAETRAYVRAA